MQTSQMPVALKVHGFARFGEWLRQHHRLIGYVQWSVVCLYAFLIIVPVFLPLPPDSAHIWSNLTLIAQFAFWGIWWPFVLFSIVFMGRIWCGILCPEGTLTEFASRYGRGGSVPRWMRWAGWPFVAFVLTTVYGQLISVYQYPKAVLLILGGSTIGAVIVGYLYGKNKRVWCRYLCPVSGVFALLAKLSPLHYKVNPLAWKASYGKKSHADTNAVVSVNCAPLLPLRHMQGAADCHMCGRCSGYKGAITLQERPFGEEVIDQQKARATFWESLLIVFGLCGVAIGAFHWTASPWCIALKQTLAEWCVGHDIWWPLSTNAPWWLLTQYPLNNDVFSWLDGTVIVVYIALTALLLGAALSACMAIAVRLTGPWSVQRFHHLVQSLIPIGGCGVFLGLSATTVSLLRAEHVNLDWVPVIRMMLLAIASVWSLWLAMRIIANTVSSYTARCMALLPVLMALGVLNGAWVLLFAVW
jgi:polyferredoxin